MPLTIFRRHSKKCPYHGKPRNARNSRACPRRCSIYVQGSLGGEYVRMALDLTYWEPAAELVAYWEKIGRVDRQRGRETPPEARRTAPAESRRDEKLSTSRPPAEDPSTIPVREAVARFTASLQAQNLSWETIRKYRTLLNRLLAWCALEQVAVVSALSVTRMDDFRGTWKDGPLYATKNLERLRAFFQFCVEHEWIRKNSAKAVKAPQVAIVPTLPFTDAEMERIVAACERLRGRENQDRVRAFVLTMRYSGLRISDMVVLHPEQRVGTKLRLYTTKTGFPVYVPLPDFVNDALDKIERPDVRYFTTGRAKHETDKANWSAKLQGLFELAGVEKGRSHRFRDTFSCSLLEQGVPVETVAMLLGNTPAIVVKHYAPWIKSRQDAAEAAVRTTWQSPSAIAQANAMERPSRARPERRPAAHVGVEMLKTELQFDRVTPAAECADAANETQESRARLETFTSAIPMIFEAWLSRSPSENTRSAYRADVMGFFAFLGINWPRDASRVLEVGDATMVGYRRELSERGTSRSYVARRFSAISSWYRYLATAAAEMRVSIVVQNPADREFAHLDLTDRFENTPVGAHEASRAAFVSEQDGTATGQTYGREALGGEGSADQAMA